MKAQVTPKGPASLILLGVAAASIGLGIFLDIAVIPTLATTDKMLDGAISHWCPYAFVALQQKEHIEKNNVEAVGQTESGFGYSIGVDFYLINHSI